MGYFKLKWANHLLFCPVYFKAQMNDWAFVWTVLDCSYTALFMRRRGLLLLSGLKWWQAGLSQWSFCVFVTWHWCEALIDLKTKIIIFGVCLIWLDIPMITITNFSKKMCTCWHYCLKKSRKGKQRCYITVSTCVYKKCYRSLFFCTLMSSTPARLCVQVCPHISLCMFVCTLVTPMTHCVVGHGSGLFTEQQGVSSSLQVVHFCA